MTSNLDCYFMYRHPCCNDSILYERQGRTQESISERGGFKKYNYVLIDVLYI